MAHRITSLILLAAFILSGCNAPVRQTPAPPSPQPTALATATPTLIDLPTIRDLPEQTDTPTPAGSTTPGGTPTLPPGSPAPRHHAGSRAPSISTDGRYIVYQSSAADLLEQDLPVCADAAASAVAVNSSQTCQQVYLYDRETKKNELISAGPGGEPGNASSGSPRLSADGLSVVFSSSASNLIQTGFGAGPGGPGLFLYDRLTGAIMEVAQNAANPDISADGRWIVYEKGAPDSAASQIYLYDRTAGEEVLITHPDPAAGGDPEQSGASYQPAISADGKWVAFWSWDGRLVPGDTKRCTSDTVNCGDLFIYDRIRQNLTRVAMDEGFGLGMVFYPVSLSIDGRWIYTRDALYDRQTGSLVNVRIASGSGKIAANGQWLIEAHGPRVFVQPLPAGIPEQVTVSTAGDPGNGVNISSLDCFGAPQCYYKNAFNLSADGRFAVFDSTASNLAEPDPAICVQIGLIPHNCSDIFVRDRKTGQTEWVSKPVNPAPPSYPSLVARTAEPFTRLKRAATVLKITGEGQLDPVRGETAYYGGGALWRIEKTTEPPQAKGPEILAADGKTIWQYFPQTNILTINSGAVPQNRPALFGPADGVNSLADFVTIHQPLFPQMVYLGPGHQIAGRATDLFYLGQAAKPGTAPTGAGPQIIWLDQQTLVALRWDILSLDEPLPLYHFSATALELDPTLAPELFTQPAIPDAQVDDRR